MVLKIISKENKALRSTVFVKIKKIMNVFLSFFIKIKGGEIAKK